MTTARERINSFALDRDGLFTLKDAAVLGIAPVELRKLTQRGKLTRVGRGVYRTAYSRFEPKSSFREALALVGSDAFLIGESALAVHDIGVFNPGWFQIATTNRIRRKLPQYISLQRVKDITAYDVTEYDHVKSQSPYCVFKEIFWYTESERILVAIEDAKAKGFLNSNQVSELIQMARAREQSKTLLYQHLD